MVPQRLRFARQTLLTGGAVSQRRRGVFWIRMGAEHFSLMHRWQRKRGTLPISSTRKVAAALNRIAILHTWRHRLAHITRHRTKTHVCHRNVHLRCRSTKAVETRRSVGGTAGRERVDVFAGMDLLGSVIRLHRIRARNLELWQAPQIGVGGLYLLRGLERREHFQRGCGGALVLVVLHLRRLHVLQVQELLHIFLRIARLNTTQ